MLQPCRLFVCLLTIILLPSHAAAQEISPWYVGVRGGGVWLNDADLSDNTGTLQSLGVQLDMKTGFGVAAAIGREWRWPANYAADTRAEFEVSYRSNGADTATAPGFVPLQLDGDLETWTGMANVYFDHSNPYQRDALHRGWDRDDLPHRWRQ